MHKDIPLLDEKVLRQFGVILGGGLAIILGLALPKMWHLKLLPNWYWIGVGALTVIWAIIAPTSMRHLYKAWMTVALVIGNVVNTIILTIVYFIVITPMGAMMHASGRDPMCRKFDKEIRTYRQESKPRSKQNFERLF